MDTFTEHPKEIAAVSFILGGFSGIVLLTESKTRLGNSLYNCLIIIVIICIILLFIDIMVLIFNKSDTFKFDRQNLSKLRTNIIPPRRRG